MTEHIVDLESSRSSTEHNATSSDPVNNCTHRLNMEIDLPKTTPYTDTLFVTKVLRCWQDKADTSTNYTVHTGVSYSYYAGVGLKG